MEKDIQLEEMKQIELRVLKQIRTICEEQGWRYFLVGGTLLGAVKYGGFVPWDDDIDVVMKREEYEKFLEIAPGELNEKFFLQSYNNVPDFPLNYAKLCLNGTENYNYNYYRIKTMHHGVFMDIFPLDEVRPDKLKKHCSQVGVLTGARVTKLKIHKPSGIRKLVYGALAILPMKTLINMIDRRCKKYNGKNTGYFYEVCNSNKKFAPMPREIYDETVRIPFRDGEYEASAHYDRFLQSRFGENYMQELPPEAARKPSHNRNIRVIKG